MHANTLRSVELDGDGALPDGPFVGLIDGAMAPLLSFALPKGLKGNARRDVAMRQLRDQIGGTAQNIEIQPFQGSRAKDLWTHAVVKDKAVDALIDNKGLKDNAGCTAVLPDFMALPAAETVWTIDVAENSTRVRLGVDDGLSGEVDFVLVSMEKALQREKPLGVLRLGHKDTQIDAFLTSLDVPISTEPALLAAHKLPVPQVYSNNELALDLRVNAQAEMADAARNIRAVALPVLALTLALGIWLISMSINSNAARTQALDLRKDTLQTVRENFVPAGPILDVKRQVNQAILTAKSEANSDSGDETPFDLLRQAGVALNDFPDTLKSASFSQAEGVILRLSLADFKTLDQIVEAMGNVGLAVRIGSSDASSESQVRATLYVGGNDG
jgi:general secretion pathway protein L